MVLIFMKLKIRESFKQLDIDLFIAVYVGDVVNILVNKPKPYRITYIKYDDLYIIANAETNVHYDMTDKVIKLPSRLKVGRVLLFRSVKD